MAHFPNNKSYKTYLGRGTAAVLCSVLIVGLVAPQVTQAARGSAGIFTGSARVDSDIRNRVNKILAEVAAKPVEAQVSNTAEVQNTTTAHASTGGNVIGDPKEDIEKARITLRELGILQLAAHDFFNVNRTAETDSENGKLDLSTLLDHGFENIAIGGEPRNRENIILFTVAKEYGEYYLELYEKKGEEKALKKTLKKYHKELEDIYEELFDEDLPDATPGAATMTENLALRTIHDFLPGKIVRNGEVIDTLDHSLAGKTLSKKEMKALSSPLDGAFDPEFLNITIFIPPSIIFTISLLERDSSFAAQFGTDFTFEHFLAEVEDGSFDEDEDVTRLIKSLFAKGLYF